MRKLVLSICVIAVSLAYVTWTAMNRENGLQALLDRVSFQPSQRDSSPLDLDDPLLGLRAPQPQ
jgi:hypothetical protein